MREDMDMGVTVAVAQGKDGKQHLYARTPYHPRFPARARELGGNWSASTHTWIFDPRDEARVRDLCVSLFGTDGTQEPETCTITVRLTGPEGSGKYGGILDYFAAYAQDLWLCGRQVARRAERDYRVQLGEGVIVISGGFPSSGGSRKNPDLHTFPDTVLEVRDVPRSLAQQAMEAHPEAVRINKE